MTYRDGDRPSSCAHGVMFHHFHSQDHPQGQGSISAAQLEQILDWLQERHQILPPEDFSRRLLSTTLAATDICLTFDDALKCQFDVAVPVLQRRGLTAYFFVYSSPLKGTPDLLEVYRYFRSTQYADVQAFYDEFYATCRVRSDIDYAAARSGFDALGYLTEYSFYTWDDRWFRYLRDQVLGKERYQSVMHDIMVKRGFASSQIFHKLWVNEAQIKELQAQGHSIGLHSYTHPTNLHRLTADLQEHEYASNLRHLTDVLGFAPNSVSHPCGNYSPETLAILRKLGIEVGFRANMLLPDRPSNLEVPRKDHTDLLAEVTK